MKSAVTTGLSACLSAVLFTAVVPHQAAANTYVFTYAETSGGSSTWSGSFSTDATGAVGLADLTNFSFGEYLAGGIALSGYTLSPSSPDFVASLSNLLDFSANVGSQGVTSLAFDTRLVPAPHDSWGVYVQGISFVVTQLGPGGGSTTNGGTLAFNSGDVTSPSAVPEPATWTAMILGLFGLGGVLRHRRKMDRVAAGGVAI